jgi:transcriptional regulator with XRE-family HTH domain
MVNQTINRMKQPELGKKISELRKAKGLTQEQLVEICNLNVRTIQRIEAGEVSPRNHTIKALFEALEIEWIESEESTINEHLVEEQFSKNKSVSGKVKPSMNWLYLGFFAGLLYFILGFFDTGLKAVWTEGEEAVNLTHFWLGGISTVVLSSVFLRGLIQMTHIFPNRILRSTFYAMLIVNIIIYAIAFTLGVELSFGILGFYLLSSIFYGAFYVLIGVGFLSYKNIWSNYTQIIGVLGILSGILTMSIIGAFVVAVPFSLFKISLIGFLYWGINESKVKTTSSSDSTFTAEFQS